MSTPPIIQAGVAHAAVLARLHKTAFPANPWDMPSFISLLIQPGVRAFIDERGGFLLLRAVADEAEILTIGVITRRLGLGRALMQTAIAHARAQNIAKIHLEVGCQNTAARALYASFGFMQTGRRKAYYPDGTDALTLSLDIK